MTIKQKVGLIIAVLVVLKIADNLIYYVDVDYLLHHHYGFVIWMPYIALGICLPLYFHLVEILKEQGRPLKKVAEYGWLLVVMHPCLYLTLKILVKSLFIAYHTGWADNRY